MTDNPKKNSARIVVAKTGLDGHWRGATLVGRALSDAGFEVTMMGMATVEEIVACAADPDIDLLGISIGGHIDVAKRAIVAARAARPELPVFVGGVVPPWAKRELEAMGVEVYPPGSQLQDITDAAARLTGFKPDLTAKA